jgi:hypothetical protein
VVDDVVDDQAQQGADGLGVQQQEQCRDAGPEPDGGVGERAVDQV